MKKVLKVFFVFLLIVPVVVLASSFEGAKNVSNGYYKQFLYPERYLVESTEYWGLDSNGKVKKATGFTKGGLITEREIKISSKGQKNYFSYMYDGINFWEIGGKIVSENIISGIEAKTKVVEYVKHGTKVRGIGTHENPWFFVDVYNVSVEADRNGKIDGGNKSSKKIEPGGVITFSIEPNMGYRYEGNTCGTNAIVENNELKISSVEKDMTCKVTFTESKNAVTLPTPCFEVTTSLHGKRQHCFSAPVNNQLYYSYDVGYFSNENLTVRVGKLLSIPILKGWTFDGYYVGSSELISSSGLYETSYKLLTEVNNVIVAKGHANTYTITFDKQSGTGGTNSASVVYDHDLPTITIPQRTGYAFLGYYTEGGTQYYNSTGGEVKTWEEDADTILYAHWKDVTPPTCTVAKSNTGSTAGVTTTVTCVDNESGCKSDNPTGDTNLTSSKNYTVYDKEGNSFTCSVSVTSYDCNGFDCNPHDCNPHSCNCKTCGGECTAWNCCPQAGYNTGACEGNLPSAKDGWHCYCSKHADTYDCCDTCHDTCHDTCYQTCYK